MSSLHVPTKNYLLPAAMGLISIWTIYLGAVALFQPAESNKENEGARSAQREASEGLPTERTRQTSAKSNAEEDERDETVVAKEMDSRGNVSATQSEQRSATRVVKKTVTQKTKTAKKNPTAFSSKKGSSQDLREALRNRLMSEAYSLALKSEEPWKNLIAVAYEQFRRGERESAREMLVIAEKLAVDPDDPKQSSSAVREVVKAMLSMRQKEDAVDALQNITNVAERERAIAEVSAWSARMGDMETAKSLVGRIVNPAGKDVALVAIAENEAAYEGIAHALQTVSMIVNKRKKDDAYRRIAIKRAGVKDFSGAEQSIQQIRDNRLQDRTYASLARLRARSGDLSGGLQILQNIGNSSIEDTTLRELSTELAKLGRFADSALVTTRIRDEKEKSYALEGLSVEQARVGDLSAALVKISAIPVDAVRDRGLRYVSATTAHNGHAELARNVAVRIDSGRERDKAYRAIAQAAAAGGDHHDAYNTLQNISRPDEKALAMVSMARYRLRQGDERQALALLEDARRSSAAIVSHRTRDRINADMAIAYAERLDSDYSLLLATSIRDRRRRDTTLGNLARTLVGKNDISAAQQSLHSISTEKIRLTAEDHIARAVAKKTDPQNALKASRQLNPGRQRIVFLLEVSRKS